MDASYAPPVDVARRYRIAPWTVWVLVPIVAAVAIVSVISSGTAPAVLVPVIAAVAAGYLYATERCGVYSTAWGIESRMTHRANSFRIPWSEIEGFTVTAGQAQLAIAAHLTDGRQMILPSTRAWAYSRQAVETICELLNRDRIDAHGRPS